MKKYPQYKIILAFCDFLIIRTAFSVALQLRSISLIHGALWRPYIQSTEFLFFFLYAFGIVLVFQNNNLYKINIFLTRSRQIVLIFTSFFYSVIGLAVIAFFIHSVWIHDARRAVAYFFVIGFASVSVFRIVLFRPLFIYLSRKKVIKKNVLIIGSNRAAKTFAIQMQLENIYGLHLVGFVDENLPKGAEVFEHYEVLGKVSDVPDIVREREIAEIIITVSEVDHEDLLHIIDVCKGTPAQVKVTSSLFDIIHKKVFSESYFNIPIAPLANLTNVESALYLKRVVDVIGASIGVIILAVPFLLISILIKLSSRGPVFYKQTRIGKDGREFNFYKFRSMYAGSDQDKQRIKKAHDFIRRGKNGRSAGDGNGSQKVVNENMITPIGRFLRKTSIDELPQLFNVLKGDMSLVGPRPCLPYEYDAYDEWHKRRLSILPGCTGLWQVSSRSEVGFDDMVLLDLYYIENVSPWLDLQLILKTIPVMALGRGGK